MKGKKCFGLLLALSIIFGLSLSVFSEDTSAFGFGTAGVNQAQSVTAQGDVGGNSVTWNGVYNGVGRVWTVNIYSDYAYPILTKWGPNANAPNGTLFNFSVRYQTSSPNNISMGGVTNFNSGWILLDQNCIVQRYNSDTDGRLYSGDTYCTYWGYSAGDYIGPILQGRVWMDMGYNSAIIMPSSISYVYITDDSGSTFNGLTEQQLNGDFKTWLQSQISNLYAQGGDQLTALNQIKALINTQGQDTTAIRETVESMLEQEQEDRDNIEQQSEDINTDASSSQSDAQSTGTTLLGAFSSFVNAMTSASPSNCNIDMDLGNLDLGVVNLCTLSLPAPFQALASIFLILFCVPLSIATARKVINLFRSFQG